MKKLSTILVAAFIIIAGRISAQNHLITAKLTGMQQNPPLNVPAVGIASFMVSPTDSVCINVFANNLSGPITGIHIHEGMMGVNGPVVKDLDPFVSGNFTSAWIGDFTKAQMDKLLKGMYYVNIHTAAHPDGEIRGQLQMETDWAFSGMLSGSQQVPSITTNAMGLVVARLSNDKSMLNFDVVFKGLSGAPTGAHLHKGAMGANGPVVVDVDPYISGNTIRGSVSADGIVQDLMAGNIYLNIHTAANPNGEIRAQLVWDNYINFDAMLDGMQETPPTSAVGKGNAIFKVNHSRDSVWYAIMMDSLTGPAMGAHLHMAATGSSGPVVVDLSSGISGNAIMGVATALPTSFLSNLAMGNIYVNVHTAANPNGELRGQLKPFGRMGFVMNLNGMQQVPAVNAMGMGLGTLSIDRDMTNAQFMFVVSGLTAALNGAHFHQAAMGANGGVIFDLDPYFAAAGTSDSAFGTWRTGFTPALAMQIANGNVYANIHTTANPNGEIRGQANNMGCFKSTVTGIEQVAANAEASVYPNPAGSNVTLSFIADGTATVSISNMLGQKVYAANVQTAQGRNEVKIPVDGWPAGIYFISVECGNKVSTVKFTKE